MEHDNELPLGKTSHYVSEYTPTLLYGIPRSRARESLGIEGGLPFKGADVWTAYELSWLNEKGRPEVAVGEFFIPCDSPCIIESKSFKLYLNSFNQTRFVDIKQVLAAMEKDLSRCAGAAVLVELHSLQAALQRGMGQLAGECIDSLDIDCDVYEPQAELLQCEGGEVTVNQSLYSHLFKSNCPVTGQPDWASLQVHYTGKAIDRAALLRYLVSYREHQGFHEDCVEKIFLDLIERCQPERLTVSARFTRRGGLDINPYRSNCGERPEDVRLVRQ